MPTLKSSLWITVWRPAEKRRERCGEAVETTVGFSSKVSNLCSLIRAFLLHTVCGEKGFKCTLKLRSLGTGMWTDEGSTP